ncbi:hypothetical protein UPYG_G00042310 [Umbra pygmaea]|uniref:C3H1-type domain-containing protein n=1 Tax=Umbra pygmaea TaxID=75934 RepID=A0ABD0XQE6_UMBPY
MNSLVGYGVSSDSDSEGDGEDGNNNKAKSEVGGEEETKKLRNFLLEAGSASSESDCDSSTEEVRDPASQLQPKHPPACGTPPSKPLTPAIPAPPSSLSHKLPPPPLGASSKSGVFANPFKAQADQKLNALQKHVPLTQRAWPSEIGGKRICVAYRKDGRCRFGISCKFAHDSDLQRYVNPNDYNSPAGDSITSDKANPDVGSTSFSSSQNLNLNQGGEPEEEEEGLQSRKRRVGLSNTLVPPKRAMKNFAMQRKREQVNLN